MEVCFFDSLPSTHLYAVNAIKQGKITHNTAILSNKQTAGIGSRGNVWLGDEGNLYLSLCLFENAIKKDVPLSSLSIYFATILWDILQKKGSFLWIKWPNDFYINDKKCGGVMSEKIKNAFVVSVGMNLKTTPFSHEKLDIDIDARKITELFCHEIKKSPSWKCIFSLFKLQFELNKNFTYHKNGIKYRLKDAILCNDGSIQIENEKVYSLR